MKTILIVDEEVKKLNVLQLLIKTIESKGYKIETTISIDDAVKKVKTKPYDALVLDIMMPTGTTYKDNETEQGYWTGVHFLKDLRKGTWGTLNSDVRVILFSYISNSDVKTVIEQYLDEKTSFVEKPFIQKVINDLK